MLLFVVFNTLGTNFNHDWVLKLPVFYTILLKGVILLIIIGVVKKIHCLIPKALKFMVFNAGVTKLVFCYDFLSWQCVILA